LSLWVIGSGIPGTEAAAGVAQVRNTTTAGTDALNAIGLRQGAKNISPSVIVDGIRVGTSWSSILSQPLTPTVSTAAVTSITSSGALAGGTVTAAGGSAVTRRGLLYSTNAITDTNSLSGGGKIIDASGGTGAYSASQVGGFFGAGSNGNSDTFTSTLTGVFINGANENGVAAFDASTLSSFFTTKTYIGAVQNSTDTSFAGWTCNSAIANFGSTSSACTSLPIT
jgi:hypothetical protein